MIKFSKDDYIYKFQKESNAIEGIDTVTQKQVNALYDFVKLDVIKIDDLVKLAKALQPRKSRKNPYLKPPKLRDKSGRNVSVGNFTPIPGGPWVTSTLEWILRELTKQDSILDSYKLHQEYEKLHPFTDCNGRTGRALWLWKRRQELTYTPRLLFLQSFYYQSLEYYKR